MDLVLEVKVPQAPDDLECNGGHNGLADLDVPVQHELQRSLVHVLDDDPDGTCRIKSHTIIFARMNVCV